jgi:tRNA(fMet)-specific endonuclease VapC
MAPRYLLDTNICIYIMRRKPERVLARFLRKQPGSAAFSIVTYAELQYGAAKSAARQSSLATIEELISIIPVLQLPTEAAEEYGATRAALERKGTPIGGNDLWIAAHAKAAGLILVTNNEREFKRVAGLKVENWSK